MGERRTVIIGIMVAVFVGAVLIWSAVVKDPQRSAKINEVTDTATIQNSIQVSHISIATGENYLGNKIRVITGTLKNISNKPLRMADLKMSFTDFSGKPIQESVERGYDTRQKPLEPGAQYRFEINFENLPRTWNYRIPIVEVVKLGY